MSGKKVVMIIAKNNFRDEEYFEPRKILTNAGIEVITASSSLDEATGMFKGKVKPDILIDDINVDDYSAVIFIGGSGSSEYFNNKVAHKIAKDAYEKGKIVAAICIAPVTLANAGILQGKKTSVYISEKNTVISKGAKYTTEGISVDGNIVTASGPQFATDFGLSLRKMILGK